MIKMKKILLILVLGMFFISFANASNTELIQECWGDEELVICPMSYDAETIFIGGEIGNDGILRTFEEALKEKEKQKEKPNFFPIFLILLLFLICLLFFIYKNRRKRIR